MPLAQPEAVRDARRTAVLNGVDRVRPQSVPVAPVRLGQRLIMKRAGRTRWQHPRVDRPTRVLVRVDEFPHYQAWDDPRRYGIEAFETFHRILEEAGVPYLIAALPAVSRQPLDPSVDEVRLIDDEEVEVLRRLHAQGVSIGLHGYDHRTRDAAPRRHSEISGLGAEQLAAKLNAGERVLAERGLPRPRTFIAPYNRFDVSQWQLLAERYDVVTGGPESVVEHGRWRTPSWRGEAVYLPAYEPYYADARTVFEAVKHDQPLGWVPIVLHWGWEADQGWDDLRRLADHLAPHAASWPAFLDAVEESR